MSLQLILATGNENKVREVHEILAAEHAGADIRIRSLRSVGIASDPEENGNSFEENALIKARAAAAAAALLWEGTPAPGRDRESALHAGRKAWMQVHGMYPEDVLVFLSDDSGLVIDALGGAPGIHSARYLGRDSSYAYKMEHILKELCDVPEEKRIARFVAAIAAVLPDGTELTARGTMDGVIAREPRGGNGFGYDPILFLPEFGKTGAELAPEQKNAVSHRGKGMRRMLAMLRERYAV